MKKRFTLLVILALLYATGANAQYCYQYWYNYGYEYMSNVTFGSINNNSSYQYYGGYDDYSYMSASVLKGQSYDLSVTGYSLWGDSRFKAWIDWNNDKTFDPSEVVYDMQNSSCSNYTQYTKSIQIPANAVTGSVRMRLVWTVYFYNYILDNPCNYSYYSYAETEDYTIDITQPALDASVSALVNPNSSAAVDTGTAVPFKIDLHNGGTNTLTSVAIDWDLDGVAGTTYNWTGSLLTDSTAKSLQIGTINITPGSHTLRAWTSSPNGGVDGNTANDMYTFTFCTAERSKKGSFTVGSGGDFATISAAIAMMNCGIVAPVVFNLAPSTFTGRIVIDPVMGASATNTITFRGAGRDYTTLSYNGSSPSSRSTVVINGAKYIKFEKMTIASTGGNYATCVYFTKNAQYNTISDCKLQVNNNNTNNYVVPVEFGSSEGSYQSSGNNGNYNIIDGNQILGGYYGVLLYGKDNNTMCFGNKISNNSFKDQYQYGIYSYYQRDLLLQRNIIDIGTRSLYDDAINNNYCQKSTIDGNTIKPGTCGIYTSCENQSSSSDSTMIINNMISNFKNTSHQIGYSANYGNYNLRIYHNSIKVNGTNQNDYNNTALYLYAAYNVKIKNNILECESGKGSYLISAYPYFYGAPAQIDYNDYFYAGTSSGMFYNDNVSYNNLTNWKNSTNSIALPHDDNSYDQLDPNFVSATDLHLQNRYCPLKGKNIGVLTDKDGDSRCLFEVTLGADESKSSFTKPTAGFISEDTVCLGTPVTFMNNAGANEPKAHKWYVNDVLRSTKLNFTYTFNDPGIDTVSLVTIGCGGSDTFTKYIFIGTPAGTPVANMIADVNIVETYWPVYLSDLSTGCPDNWDWSISPALDNLGNPTYDYITGTNNSQNPEIWFFTPGKYKICLRDSNSINGIVASICKEDFIIVKSLAVMCMGSNYDYSPYGVLYDDVQGPTYMGPALRTYCNYTINTCSDSLVLTFRKFDVGGNDYVRIYEGVDNTGKPLWNQTLWPLGPGHNTNMNTPGFQTTFVSKTGKMYIEWQRAAHGSQITIYLEGFEAEWIGYSDSFPKPKADFAVDDTVCLNMWVDMQNTSVGGYGDPVYLWDFDGMDMNYSTDVNGRFLYTTTGRYPVKLKLTDCGGVDSMTKYIVVVQPSKAPTPKFSANIIRPFANYDAVTLIDESYKCVDNWKWVIIPNTYSLVGTSKLTDQNPVVKFIDSGCYTIRLVAGYNNYYDSLTVPCFIRAISYCIPTAANLNQDVGISRVIVGTLDNMSAIGSTSYTDYTGTKSTILELQSTYDVTVQRNTSYNATNRKVWIDYNIDGDFDDPGELVASEINASTVSWTGSFKVPATATIGATRMRVGITLSSFSTVPCGNTPYGEFEDYRIYIREDQTPPVITLLGVTPISIEQCSAIYSDSGATAWDNVNGNITSNIVITNNLNLNKVGSYWYHYDVSDAHGNKATMVERVINITPEKVNPSFSLIGPQTITVIYPNPFVDPGYNASDACSGIDNVVVTGTVNPNVVGTYILSYICYDKAGNHVSAARTVIVKDTTDPTIALVGPSTVYLQVGDNYTDAGAVAFDDYCTGLTPKVSGNVDKNHLGTYVLTYSVLDCNGNGPVSVNRTIIVYDSLPPVITYTGPDTFIIEVFDNFVMPYFSTSDNYCTSVTVTKQGSFYTTFPNEKATTLGDYIAEYEATDCQGNKTKFHVVVRVVDTEKPILTLQGPAVINICRFATINSSDDTVSISDNYDNIPLNKVVKTGNYFTDYLINRKEGFYFIYYDVSDNSGNNAIRISRAINVTDCKLSVQEGLSNYVKLYPNPNNGQFVLNVQLPTSNNITIIVTNTLGQIVKQMSEIHSSGNTYQLDLSSFGSGLYMVKVSTDKESAVFPVSVTR